MMINNFLSRFRKTETQLPTLNEPASSESFSCCTLYSALFSQHPDGVVLFNSDGKVTDCNQKITTIFGYSLEELKNDFFRFVDDDYVKAALRNFKKALKGETREYSLLRITKEGSRFHVNATLSPVIIENTIHGVLGIFRDNNKFANLQDHLTRAQQIAHVGSWDYFPKDDYIFWTDQIYTIFGIQDRSSFGPTVGKFINMIYPDDRDVFTGAFDKALKEGIGFELEFRILKISGEVRTCIIQVEPLINTAGDVIKLTGVMKDITEKTEINHLFQQRDKQMTNLIQTIDAAVWSFDVKNNKMLLCSDAVYKIFGFSPTELPGSAIDWQRFLHPEDRENFEQNLDLLLKGHKLNHEYRIIDPAGNVKWVEDHITPTLDENGKLVGLDGIMFDISNRKSYEEMLEHSANYDFLTGLPNRRLFEKEFSQAVDRAKRQNHMLSLLMLDLDRFKNVNDALGHIVGDNLLIAVAGRLSELLGDSAFLARMSGDEFAIFVENITGMDASIAISNKILKMFQEPFFVDNYEIYITASIGITYAPYNGEDALTLRKNADIAMYRAKEAGKNDYYVYTPSMNVETFKRYSLEKDLHSALKNNELYLEYQPKVNTKTGKIESAEALLRWRHPQWGIVSPNEFIPLAEENGFILMIGDWVFQQVCQQIIVWQEKGYNPVPISINVTYKRLIKTDFIKSIVATIKETGVHPSLIEFEITERTVIQNEEVVRTVMAKLQALGFKFSLDDFGTCQSSLSYLSSFEIDIIKIDRSFINKIGQNKRFESIISSIIVLGEDLGVKIVAEGVETIEQLQFLRERNCHYIQGYLYSRPISADRFEQLLKDPVIKIKEEQESTFVSPMDRRKYFRVTFQKPLIGEMTITKIKNVEVNMGYSKILIQNIGESGLLFISQINMPLKEDITLKFTFKVGDLEAAVVGLISWKKEEKDVYMYGVKFIQDENNPSGLIEILGRLENKLSTNELHLFDSSVADFFNGQNRL